MKGNGTAVVAVLLCPPILVIILFVIAYASIKKALAEKSNEH